MILNQSFIRIHPVKYSCAENDAFGAVFGLRKGVRFLLSGRLCSHSNMTMTLGREVVDKILIDIPAVLSLTIQGALVLGMFLLATLFDSVDITLLFVIYILFWSMHYTTTFRSFLNDRQEVHNES